MRQQLEPGRFYGRTLSKRCFADLTLADVKYRAHGRVPRHSHEQAYFCLIRRGTYVERYSRSQRICEPKMLVFHPPGERHSESFGREPVMSFNVALGAEWLGRLHELGGTFDQPIAFRGGKTVALGMRLFREFADGHGDSDLCIESTILEILAAYWGQQSTGARSAKPNWLRQASEHLDACFSQCLSLGSLARGVGVHPIHFAAVFRHFNGCSVGEYVRRRRLEYAQQMLANPEIPLAEVALTAGFADQSHFTRTHKRFTGRTPSQHRTFLRWSS